MTSPIAGVSATDTVQPARTPRILGLLSFWAHVGFIAAYFGILSTAMFWFQFAEGEFPCPLCIAQRMAMMLVVIGPIYIVSQTLKGRASLPVLATGSGIAILGAVLGMAMSSRQVLLHIAPGDPGYGTAVMGMHLYTWALVTFRRRPRFLRSHADTRTLGRPDRAAQMAPLRWISWIVIALFLLTILLNAVVVFASPVGIGSCPTTRTVTVFSTSSRMSSVPSRYGRRPFAQTIYDQSLDDDELFGR